MREFLSDRKFIIAKIELGLKILVAIALIIFFLPLFVLPFFNHASADDYYYGLAFYKSSFFGYQSYIYNNWTGRFSSTLLGSLFLKNHFLYDHYYLHSLIFLLLDFLSTFLLITNINKHVLNKRFKKANVVLSSIVFTALTIVCSPEMFGLIFWFSSSIVYYAGLIFIQFELSLFIILFYSKGSASKAFCYVLLPLFVFITNGFSEVFILIQLAIFCLFYFFGFFRKTSKIFLIVLFLFFVSSAVLSFAAPGNYVRAETIPTLKLANGIVAIAFSLMQAISDIFKNPLAWFAFVFLFLSGNTQRKNFSKYFKRKSIHYLLFLCVVLIAFLLLAVGEGVIGLKGRIVPDRFTNIVCWFSLLLLSLIAFIGGTSIKNEFSISRFYKGELALASYIILLLCLGCNNYINDAYKSMISAPLYNTILTEQENVFKAASKKKSIAIVKTYDVALKELMQKNFSNVSMTYTKWAQQKPAFIFNNNGDSDEQSILVLKNFYGVDSVIIKK